MIDTVSSTKEEQISFAIPEDLLSRNLFIEVSSLTRKKFEPYFSTNLKTTITENLGEVKVTDQTLKPLSKVYVKCFAKMKNEEVKFYKDGYTDLRGRFNYLSLNTDSMSQIAKFSLLIMDDSHGSIIKECSPPANLAESSPSDPVIGYDEINQYRQNLKNNWKSVQKSKK